MKFDKNRLILYKLIRQLLAPIIFLIGACFFNCQAQPRKGNFIDVSAGLGISAYDYEVENEDIEGLGFFAQWEYVIAPTTWFAIRPYVGVLLTSSDYQPVNSEQPKYEVTTNAFLLGGKIRLLAPIPWVAPYAEIGLGMSLGKFRTFTTTTDIEKNGAVFHIPFTLGLALGRQHAFDIEFTYYFHPSIDQFGGAAAVGFSFPVEW